METEFFERFEQLGRFQIFNDDARAGSKRRLHPRLHVQPLLHRLLCEQTRCYEDIRIGGVGAGSDRRDHDGTVADFGPITVLNDGRRVLFGSFQFKAAIFDRLAERIAEILFHGGEPDTILRPFRAGEGWFDGGKIEFEYVGVFRSGGTFGTVEPLLFGVTFNEIDIVVAATSETHVVEGRLIDREIADGGAVFRRHVGDHRFDRESQIIEGVAEVFDKFPDHPSFAQKSE